MSDIAIKVENLGKKYVIGHHSQQNSRHYLALRDIIVQNAQHYWQKTRDLVQGKAIIDGDVLEEVWALHDINFEIRHGEAVGIIGRNGAGKSTLLKILSRITEPSTGRITLRGRVASLLEVGTGFHPELTGRENIYLNGAILGMTRREIQRKFDEIVAFSGVEQYLDTPVKRYSSGMYVRLAFAVAAHLEPEILVVDEVLAVGDAEFQKKCLGKMSEVASEGRTVLFVSHNMGAVERLCEEALLLASGSLQLRGDTTSVIAKYTDSVTSFSGREPDHGNQKAWVLKDLQLSDESGAKTNLFRIGSSIRITLKFSPEQAHSVERIGLSFEDSSTQRVFVASTFLQAPNLLDYLVDDSLVECHIAQLPLLPGEYFLTVILADGAKDIERVDQAISFTVLEDDIFGTGKLPVVKQHGFVAVQADWKLLTGTAHP